MMIRDYKHLIKLQQIHTEQMFLKCLKVKNAKSMQSESDIENAD